MRQKPFVSAGLHLDPLEGEAHSTARESLAVSGGGDPGQTRDTSQRGGMERQREKWKGG